MGTMSDFERGKIVDARSAGAPVIKTAMLLDISRVTVSEVMLAYTNHGKTASAKRNSGRKSTLTETDRRTLRRIVSENHRITAAELKIHLLDPVSTELSNASFTNPTSMVGLQLLSPQLMKVMLRCVNDAVPS
jgi:transposase